MARTVSKTDASTSKSTPPKTGTDAQVQRMNNTIKSLIGSGLSKGVIGSMYRDAMKMQGGNTNGNKTMEEAQKFVKDFKANSGRTKKMYGGKAKKK